MMRYIPLWFVLLAVAFMNAIIREALYAPATGLYLSHQISVFTGIALLGLAMWFIIRKWPFASSRQAVLAGLLWVIMTEIFEFSMIHFFQGKPVTYFLYVHNITEGQFWPVTLLWLLVGPWMLYRVQSKRSTC